MSCNSSSLFKCIAYAGSVGHEQPYMFCDLHVDAGWGAVGLTTTKATLVKTAFRFPALGGTPESLWELLCRLPVNLIFRMSGRVLASGAWAWAAARIRIPRRILLDKNKKRPCSKNKLIDHGRRCAYIRSEWNCVLDVRGDFARFENHNSCGCSCWSSEPIGSRMKFPRRRRV